MPRDDRDKYRGDVWYEEWCRGLPEGAISDDRIDDGFYAGRSPESLVDGECERRQKRLNEARVAEEEARRCEQERAEDIQDDYDYNR